MLQQINLDDEYYDELLKEAQNVSASYYPKWTNQNYYDPGIAMLELFAMFTEVQRYYMDQIGEDTKKKYFKFLGIQQAHKTPSRSLVKMDTEENVTLLRNHKLLVGDILFEVNGAKTFVGSDIMVCMAQRDDQTLDLLSREKIEFGGKIDFYPFGKDAVQKDICYIGYDRPLDARTEWMLYIKLFEEYKVKRNPIGENDFMPFVKLQFEYFADGRWIPMEQVEDGTRGLLFSGFISFSFHEEMDKVNVMGEDGYFIRIVLAEGRYDVVPCITNISMNVCEVYQRDRQVEALLVTAEDHRIKMNTYLSVTGKTSCYKVYQNYYIPEEIRARKVSEKEDEMHLEVEADGEYLVVNYDWNMLRKEIVGYGNGFPEQMIEIDDLQVEHESLLLLVQDIEHPEWFRRWKMVEDFGASTPEDMHYVFDSATGSICFGNGYHGMCPEGEIRLIGYARTLGSDGNVKQGKQCNVFLREESRMHAYSICDGAGGKDEEQMESVFFRAREGLKYPSCAVTASDYEYYVWNTPGLMIENCKVIPTDSIRKFMHRVDENMIYLVVKPYGHKRGEQISKSYQTNIRGYLEQFRQVGSGIYILSPEYVDVELYVDFIAKPQYARLKERLEKEVRSYFKIYENNFGMTISYSELYGFLDRLEFVVGVRSLNLDVNGNGVIHGREGDIHLSPNGLAVLGRIYCTFVVSE